MSISPLPLKAEPGLGEMSDFEISNGFPLGSKRFEGLPMWILNWFSFSVSTLKVR